MKSKKFKTAPNGEPVIEACENKGIAVGLNKGYPVTKISYIKKRKKKAPSEKTLERRRFVHELITEVAGFTPYERRVMELLKLGKEKRALKVCKAKLGTHLKAKKKREHLSGILRKMKF